MTTSLSSPPLTSIVLVLDESGSMSSLVDVTRASINQFLRDQKEENLSDGALVSMITFADEAKTIWHNIPFANVKELSKHDLKPAGRTALWDGIGLALDSHAEEFGTVVVILTDGEENASRSFHKETILARIHTLETTRHWKFVYLGANQDAFTNGTAMGITRSSQFEATESGMSEVMHRLSKATHSHRRDRQHSQSLHVDFSLSDE